MTELLNPADTAAPERTATLRIGLVCPYSLSVPGGVQNHILGLAGYLTANGDRVSILAPGDLDPDRARQHGLRPEQFTSVGTALPVPYNGSVARITFGPRTAARVRRWLTGRQLDLVHIHEPLAPSVSLLSLFASRVPVAATFHTATPRSRLLRAVAATLHPAIERIGAGIAVSASARDVVVQHLGRHPQLVPNGIRAGEFDCRPDDRTGPDQQPEPDTIGTDSTASRQLGEHRWRGGARPRMVFLGRLDEPRKGLSVLLDALPLIKRRHPDLEVVIAGQGSPARIERCAARLPPGCRVVGEVDDRRRDALLRSADLFIAPHIDRESFGIVLIEAIAAGATVVASDLPAFIDLLTVHDQVLGYLFATGNPGALADTVDRALADDRGDLNADARAAVSRYDWSVVGPAVRDIYRRLLTA